jgi:hypothetical protein
MMNGDNREGGRGDGLSTSPPPAAAMDACEVDCQNGSSEGALRGERGGSGQGLRYFGSSFRW